MKKRLREILHRLFMEGRALSSNYQNTYKTLCDFKNDVLFSYEGAG